MPPFFLRYAICLVLFFSLVAEARAAGPSDCSIATTAIQVASRIRGLKPLHSVPCQLRNRQEVEEYLRTTVARKIAPGKMRNEERAYKILGLIPSDFDYVNGIIALYTSQIGGYYDPEQNYYAMAGWLPEGMQMPIAIHELTHALQDQHYDLEGMMDQNTLTTDSLMARLALAEGDATAVMLDHSRKVSGQKPLVREESVSGLMMQNITGAMLSSSMHQAPPGLQALLVFPYVSGLNFVHHLIRSGGYKAVDRSFKDLPRSTSEILHPTNYTSRKGAQKELEPYRLSDAERSALGEPVFSDRLGEFVISTLLGNWIPLSRASRAAEGWISDRLAVYELRGEGLGSLTWTTEWSTTGDAKEFFASMTEAYNKRLDERGTTTSAEAVTWEQKNKLGPISLVLTEKQVVMLVNIKP